jgi:hypothetical protein
MSFFEQMIEKITDVYNKSPLSNISKIIQLISDELDKIKETLDTSEKWRDIDQAEGKTLDLIGQNVGQPRNNLSDEEFRLQIKTKIKANTSKGDIETINEVGRLLLGDRFVRVREGWTLPTDYPITPQEAKLLITVLSGKGIPFAEFDRIKASGVKIDWQYIVDGKKNVQTSYETSDEDSRVYTAQQGVSSQQENFEASYLMCGVTDANDGVLTTGEVW